MVQISFFSSLVSKMQIQFVLKKYKQALCVEKIEMSLTRITVLATSVTWPPIWISVAGQQVELLQQLVRLVERVGLGGAQVDDLVIHLGEVGEERLQVQVLVRG